MKRRKIVAGNWKMNLDIAEAIQLTKDIKKSETDFGCDVMLFPSFLFLTDVKKALAKSGIKLGAQNCSSRENGALTGEVSVTQLKGAGVEYVIIGHSERRDHFDESNGILKEKVKIALKHGLKPIFCCGESTRTRNEMKQEPFVLKQLKESLFDFSTDEIQKIIIAYEPIWAIGTGVNATPQQAQQMHAFIRKQIASEYSNEVAAKMQIIYGGSCKPDNAATLFECPDVDGGLIGGASLKANDFLAIIAAAK